jgi:hypothetical protein
MSLFLAMQLATGIYNPQVMHNGHCIAEPGSVAAVYCVQRYSARRCLTMPSTISQTNGTSPQGSKILVWHRRSTHTLL